MTCFTASAPQQRVGLSSAGRSLALGGLALLGAWLFAACQSPAPAVPARILSGPRFVLELKPGENYRSSTRWLIFELPIYPQVAVWVESLDGRYLGTLYVTAKTAKQSFLSAPEAGRPEALPVWSALRQGELDALAAATSSGETHWGSDLAAQLPKGVYRIRLETNRSYDYNDRWTSANAGVSGQPSLVYEAQIDTGRGPGEAEFLPIGTGAADGSDGLVRPGLEGIDSALRLFSRLSVAYRE